MPRLPRLFIMDSHWSERALECISTLLKDPTAQQLFGNGTIAEHHVDLRSVGQRLASGGFSSPGEVLAEVDGIWAAHRRSHPPGSATTAACDQLEASLNLLWRQAGLDAKESASPGPNSSRGAEASTADRHQMVLQPQQMLASIEGMNNPNGQEAQPSIFTPLIASSPIPGSPVSAASNFQAPSIRRNPANGRSPATGRAGHPLQRCLSAIEAALTAAQQPPSSALLAIRDALAPGALRGWGTVEFKSSGEVRAALRRCNLPPAADQLLGSFWVAQGLGPWDDPGLEPPLSLPISDNMTTQNTLLTRQGSWASSKSLGSEAAVRSASLVTAHPQKGGRRGGGGGRATGTRCEVCVRQKRGNCGTALAPKGCLYRPATSGGEVGAHPTGLTPGTPLARGNSLSVKRTASVTAKHAAKEREALAALRNLHRKREAAAEAVEQLRQAIALEQQAAKTTQAIKDAHARLREPPEQSVQEECWPPTAKVVPAGYDLWAAQQASRATRQQKLEMLGGYWLGCGWVQH